MEKDWVKIFSSKDAVKAELVKILLDENGIPAVVINKKESLTMLLGEAEVYVRRDDVLKATNLIQSNN